MRRALHKLAGEMLAIIGARAFDETERWAYPLWCLDIALWLFHATYVPSSRRRPA